MSSRALKKKLAAEAIISSVNERNNSSTSDDDDLETSQELQQSGARPKHKLQPYKNPFELLNELDDDNNDVSDDKNEDSGINSTRQNQAEGEVGDSVPDQSCTAKKKRKKKKKGKKSTAYSENSANGFDDILQEFATKDLENGLLSFPGSTSDSGAFAAFSPEAQFFTIEHRLLNPETEMKRIFGSKFSDPEVKRATARKAVGARIRGGKLVIPKNNWPQHARTGLSMNSIETNAGVTLFQFEHAQTYQEAQNMFWEAVDMMNPDAFAAILHHHPYHIDTLLQLSEVMRANEDFSASRDLVERAIYACEAAFHPLFKVAECNCRLDYRQQENRPFFIALYRYLGSLCERGCHRTALEFCKLIYGLDVREDPLGMMLLCDFLALKAKQYDWLLALYNGLEASRNLSQLPNFSFSCSLAAFQKSQEKDADKLAIETADSMLQEALLKFPTLLMPLLDACNVEPDKEVSKCPIFGTEEQMKDAVGLKQLITLYVSRCGHVWKDADIMTWVERNVRQLLPQLPSSDPNKWLQLAQEYRSHRRTRYQGTPRNILRHIVISDVKEAMAILPAEVREQAILSYDPLPPLDSRCQYERPTHQRRLGNESFLTGLIRSLMPNYDPDAQAIAAALEADPAGGEEGAVGGGIGNDMQNSVRNLLTAMRDLLNNVEIQAAPREDEHAENQPNNPDNNDAEWQD